MFRIKICGITNQADALAAASAGADAIGLNFYDKSKRYVKPEIAQRIAAAVPAGMMRVGVFVNATPEAITKLVERVPLDAVQLHGDEPAELLAQLPPELMVIRAHGCDRGGLAPLARFISACRMHGRLPDAVLIDADASSDYGGTGQIADWEQIVRQREILDDVPLILAGGLTPTNVGDAIAQVGPDAVDVASGVENEPGRKNATLVAQFVASARLAFSIR